MTKFGGLFLSHFLSSLREARSRVWQVFCCLKKRKGTTRLTSKTNLKLSFFDEGSYGRQWKTLSLTTRRFRGDFRVKSDSSKFLQFC